MFKKTTTVIFWYLKKELPSLIPKKKAIACDGFYACTGFSFWICDTGNSGK